MNISDSREIKQLLKENAEKLPLGYQFLKEPVLGKGVFLVSTSKFHNCLQFPVGRFYKPISSLDL